ncbi:hypothetical protein, variant 2 [Exophiala xenobiotica]|uniref:Sulfotransferase domain-containing protein n=1 Tax=Exophiala xenobiotica TaxID=348802 RepID=A0A0D2F188_9EURO|nr:hypothetical protein, variant 1 [Exophiala xenobiotica]XP_013321298.1 hypothetical protein, variant 2 [Exophiala xenobiotica]XP_013321299.1 uncharacterized protein PV05_00912 [Exophiala xenobiotica]KIW60713.1 hypothetical protein PV05_00912 [Exophiala xenobiotica]KIW60714.1 hypothetical protein, variant 1 [Exophiala xenobiotica]KIW60715.1 hypothetical protein, variant 2 [Exophiala xenobiotica]
MTSESSGNPTRGIFLFTHPRTASNLLLRILNLEHQPAVFSPTPQDPSTMSGGREYGYFFLPTMGQRLELATRPLDDWTEQESIQTKRCFQECSDDLMSYAEDAVKSGKLAFVKEHLYWMISPFAERPEEGRHSGQDADWKVTIGERQARQGGQELFQHNTGRKRTGSTGNPSVLPDDFFLSWTPTFLIRHPALVFPSLYRTSVDLEGQSAARSNIDGIFRSEMTMRWLRVLWMWFTERYREQQSTVDSAKAEPTGDRQQAEASRPIILDADDIILEPEVVHRYCELTGLDPTRCRYEWPAATAVEHAGMSFIEKRMKSSLLASKGIVREGKTAVGLDIEEETKKWEDEFGGLEAGKIRRWVYDALPDYEFLRAARLRP